MDREQMKMAILEQEQFFRQQVQELHRLYHVQRHLMQQMPPTATATATRAPATVAAAGPRPGLVISSSTRPATHPQQFLSFSSSSNSCKKQPPAPAPAEECNLELTLATGPSGNGGGKAGWQPSTKKPPSNSDSGTTEVSSTSTDSELAQFREAEAVRFGSESRRMDEVGQGAWMYQCLTLRTA